MTQKKSQAERHAWILEAAIACFIQKGFHATSMRDIAQAAAVSLGNLYNYFPNKQALIAEVAHLEQVELIPLLDCLDGLDSPSAEQLQQWLASYWALCRQHEWAILSIECLAEMARNPALLPEFERNRTALRNSLAAAIERGAQQAAFKPIAPAPCVAQTLLDAIESEALRQVLAEQAAQAGESINAEKAAIAAPHPSLLRGLLGV